MRNLASRTSPHSIRVPLLAPVLEPVQVSVPVLAPVPVSILVSVLTLVPEPVQVSVPLLAPVSVSILVSVSAPAPVQVSVLVVAPVPVLAPVSTSNYTSQSQYKYHNQYKYRFQYQCQAQNTSTSINSSVHSAWNSSGDRAAWPDDVERIAAAKEKEKQWQEKEFRFSLDKTFIQARPHRRGIWNFKTIWECGKDLAQLRHANAIQTIIERELNPFLQISIPEETRPVSVNHLYARNLLCPDLMTPLGVLHHYCAGISFSDKLEF